MDEEDGATAAANPLGTLECPFGLEREQNIEDLLSVPRLLDVREVAAATIIQTCLRDLLVIDLIVVGDVLGTDDAVDHQLANLVVDPGFLAPVNDEIAVRQHLGDDGRDLDVDFLVPVDDAIADGT